MQLMPATAEETARRAGVSYSALRLTTDAAYNARLGSTYLAGQLDRYDGSLVLAAAAYNAGAGNVEQMDPGISAIRASQRPIRSVGSRRSPLPRRGNMCSG